MPSPTTTTAAAVTAAITLLPHSRFALNTELPHPNSHKVPTWRYNYLALPSPATSSPPRHRGLNDFREDVRCRLMITRNKIKGNKGGLTCK